MRKYFYYIAILAISACSRELPEVKSPCASINIGNGQYIDPCVRRPVNNWLT